MNNFPITFLFEITNTMRDLRLSQKAGVLGHKIIVLLDNIPVVGRFFRIIERISIFALKMFFHKETQPNAADSKEAQENGNNFTLLCQDQAVVLPGSYKETLAKHSFFFKSLFNLNFKEKNSSTIVLSNIRKDYFEKMLEMTSNNGMELPEDWSAEELMEFGQQAFYLGMDENKAFQEVPERLSLIIEDLAYAQEYFDFAIEIQNRLPLIGHNQTVEAALEAYFKKLISSMNIDEALVFLEKNQSRLKFLDLSKFADLNENQLDKFLLYCPELMSLSLRASERSLEKICLAGSCLRSLCLKQSEILTEEALARLTSLSHLRKLKLGWSCWSDAPLTIARLTILAQLTNLEELDLSECVMLDDEDLALLAPLTRLKILNLHYHRNLTDAGLAHIAKFSHLQELDLFCACELLMGNGFAHLVQLPLLQKIMVSKISDTGLAYLTQLPNLQELILHRCEKLTDVGFAYLAKCVHLRVLDLSNCVQLTDNNLIHISQLTQLQKLSLVGCSQLSGLPRLAKLINLRSLNLKGCKKLTDIGIAVLAQFTRLQELNLGDCRLTGDGLAHIAQLTRLQLLNLSAPYPGQGKLKDKDLVHLSQLTRLRKLNLERNEQLKGPGFAHLTQLSHLQQLNLYNCKQLTDIGLAHIASLTSLQRLDLSSCDKLTDEGFAHLAALTYLQKLKIENPKLTNTGWAYLTHLTHLQELYIFSCDFLTDDGLPHLGQLTHLQTLDLCYCKKLTNKGLPHLVNLTRLEYLTLYGCDIQANLDLIQFILNMNLKRLTLPCKKPSEEPLKAAFDALSPKLNIVWNN